jgi:hypothetical protein
MDEPVRFASLFSRGETLHSLIRHERKGHEEKAEQVSQLARTKQGVIEYRRVGQGPAGLAPFSWSLQRFEMRMKENVLTLRTVDVVILTDELYYVKRNVTLADFPSVRS